MGGFDLCRRARLGTMAAQVRRSRVFMKLEVAAEHADQVFFQAHHQRMDPGVEHHVGALETHLR